MFAAGIRARIAGREGLRRAGTQLRRQPLQRGLRIRRQPVVGRRQIDGRGRQRELLGDEHGVAFVARIAVAGQQHRGDGARRRQLRQPRDDGRIDAAAQPHDESTRPGSGKVAPHPSRDPLSCWHRRTL